MNRETHARAQAMHTVQTAHFALSDIALYLDTHPCCAMGLAYYHRARAQYEAALEQYERSVGPLAATAVCGDTWAWTQSAWPWELED